MTENKTAKEMFEELGWVQETNNKSFIVYERGFRTIVFLRYEKAIVPLCYINVRLLKAINKQCEELGWL